LAIGLIETNMSLRNALSVSPVLFPLAMNAAGDLIQFVNLNEPSYQSISFLDHRILQHNTPTAVIPWSELSEAAKLLPLQCDFIFHISHAGSTLYSRLLAAHPAIFSLREPGILRTLGQGNHLDHLPIFLRLWSRTFRATQTALIKATSFVSEMGPHFLTLVPDAKAILMYVPAATFLRALLDGSMSDIESQAQARLNRIHRHGLLHDTVISQLSPGECVAMSWLAEMLSLSRIATQFPNRTLWVNFDAFLESSNTMLTDAFAHIGIETEISKILESDIMGQYAKKPEVSYNANFRLQLLQRANHLHGPEIEKGLAWLDAKGYPNQSKILAQPGLKASTDPTRWKND